MINERKSGVLMHISSLFGDYGIGSFGEGAKEFIDFLKECGFTYWQTLPFCMADDCNSPYQSYSAFGGNPYFIDLDILFKKGLITSEELESQKQSTPYSCEYSRLYHTRFDILLKAGKRAQNKSEINEFIEKKQIFKGFLRIYGQKSGKRRKTVV